MQTRANSLLKAVFEENLPKVASENHVFPGVFDDDELCFTSRCYFFNRLLTDGELRYARQR
jgi:hypothetical protein